MVGEISYAVLRARVLTQFRLGNARKEDLCDANPILLAAGKYHGTKLTSPCPICAENSLLLTKWIFGTNLKTMNGSARSDEEINSIARRYNRFTVHEVEVCYKCRWNHLMLTYYKGREPKRGSNRNVS